MSVVLLFMMSCVRSKVNFLKPQPEFSDALIEIPEEYHGEFIIDEDTHIVTSNMVDGISIINDSVVVKERGNYFYVNRINKNGSYNLVIVRRVSFLDYESISLYVPEFKLSQLNIFNYLTVASNVNSANNIIASNDTVNYVFKEITVNQLSILTNSSKQYEVVRLK